MILKLLLIFGILANDKIAVDWITKYGNDFKLTTLNYDFFISHDSYMKLKSFQGKFSEFIADLSLQFL